MIRQPAHINRRQAIGAGAAVAIAAAVASAFLTRRPPRPKSRLEFQLDLRGAGNASSAADIVHPLLTLGEGDLVAVDWATQTYLWPAEHADRYRGDADFMRDNGGFGAYFDNVFLFGGIIRPLITAARSDGTALHVLHMRDGASGEIFAPRTIPGPEFAFALGVHSGARFDPVFPCPDAQRAEQVRAYLDSLGKIRLV